MREATGSTWSFMMIITFILVFAAFLVLVLSYSKAYTVKNRTLTIIEKYEGITSESAQIINSFMNSKSYNVKGACQTGWIGAIDLDGNYEKAQSGKKYFYCFTYSKKNDKYYYDIEVFYKFNLPVLGDIFTYRITGETNTFYGNDDMLTY